MRLFMHWNVAVSIMPRFAGPPGRAPVLNIAPELQRRRRDDKGQDRRETHSEYDSRSQSHPPLGRGCANRDVPRKQVDIHLEHHWQQAEHGGDRRQHYRSQTLGASSQDRFHCAARGFLQRVERIDQHDIIVHDNTGQRDDAYSAHNDAERLTCEHQTNHHADCGHNDSAKDQEGAVEAVELGHKNDRHDEQGNAESLTQKCLGGFLFLVLAFESIADAFWQIVLFQPDAEFFHLFVRQYAGQNVRLDRHDLTGIGPLDCSNFGLRGP